MGMLTNPCKKCLVFVLCKNRIFDYRCSYNIHIYLNELILLVYECHSFDKYLTHLKQVRYYSHKQAILRTFGFDISPERCLHGCSFVV